MTDDAARARNLSDDVFSKWWLAGGWPLMDERSAMKPIHAARAELNAFDTLKTHYAAALLAAEARGRAAGRLDGIEEVAQVVYEYACNHVEQHSAPAVAWNVCDAINGRIRALKDTPR